MKESLNEKVIKKVKLSLCLINEDVWRSGGVALPFLTSALNRGELPASRPGGFTPGERAAGTYWIRGWIGSRTGLDDMKRKILAPTLIRTTPAPHTLTHTLINTV
jgi:hypothetical protein